MFNKKYKMEIEQLKQENEQMKAQIMGLSFNLKITDEKVKMYESQFDAMQKHIMQLNSEIKHLTMLSQNNNKNQNDSRFY